MAVLRLNAAARQENIRALMVAAGVTEAAAAQLLDRPVLVTAGDKLSARSLAGELSPILGRTLPTTSEVLGLGFAVEVVIGDCKPRTDGRHVFVSLGAKACTISRMPIEGMEVPAIHSLLATMLACYVAGQAIYDAAGEGMPNPPPGTLEIRYDQLTPDFSILNRPVRLDETYLAGAGAIGNGFLWGARHVDLTGTLHVVDDDTVSAGNLQRQVWFDEEDIDQPKARQPCAKAQPFLPNCRLDAAECRLQEHPNRNTGPWLRRLIVAVDSRRARRQLQNELPGEVFDASTTGAAQIVLHYNRQPTTMACMGCVYPRDEREVSHDEVVAEHLGVSVEDVRAERISATVAAEIAMAHPSIDVAAVTGLAFDTLYKELCGAGQLNAQSGQQVVAPFAFVSILAGCLLLIDLMMRLADKPMATGNEWRVGPWHAPDRSGVYWRPVRSDCECCGRPHLQKANQRLWGTGSKVNVAS